MTLIRKDLIRETQITKINQSRDWEKLILIFSKYYINAIKQTVTITSYAVIVIRRSPNISYSSSSINLSPRNSIFT